MKRKWYSSNNKWLVGGPWDFLEPVDLLQRGGEVNTQESADNSHNKVLLVQALVLLLASTHSH